MYYTHYISIDDTANVGKVIYKIIKLLLFKRLKQNLNSLIVLVYN